MRNTLFIDEVGARLLAGVVLAVRCAQETGGNIDFLRGALTLAEHQALICGLDWASMLANAREALGSDVAGLIDSALELSPGARAEAST